jgi:hypothetical protein
MAQTRNKRRRKHRGTPAGTIERAGRTGQRRTREDAKRIARDRRAERLDQPPSWRSSVNRAAIAAVVFAAVVILALGRPPAAGALLGLLMFLIYVPLGYATDAAIHRFRQRRKQAAEMDRRNARK